MVRVHSVRARLVNHDVIAPQRLGGARGPPSDFAELNEVEA